MARALSSPRWERNPLPLPIPASEFEQDTFVPWLGFKPTVRVPAHEARLIEILQAANNYALFMDTSVVGRRIDYPLIDELLRCRAPVPVRRRSGRLRGVARAFHEQVAPPSDAASSSARCSPVQRQAVRRSPRASGPNYCLGRVRRRLRTQSATRDRVRFNIL